MAYMVKGGKKTPTKSSESVIKTNPNVRITTIPQKPNIIDKAKQIYAQY